MSTFVFEFALLFYFGVLPVQEVPRTVIAGPEVVVTFVPTRQEIVYRWEDPSLTVGQQTDLKDAVYGLEGVTSVNPAENILRVSVENGKADSINAMLEDVLRPFLAPTGRVKIQVSRANKAYIDKRKTR